MVGVGGGGVSGQPKKNLDTPLTVMSDVVHPPHPWSSFCPGPSTSHFHFHRLLHLNFLRPSSEWVQTNATWLDSLSMWSFPHPTLLILSLICPLVSHSTFHLRISFIIELRSLKSHFILSVSQIPLVTSHSLSDSTNWVSFLFCQFHRFHWWQAIHCQILPIESHFCFVSFTDSIGDKPFTVRFYQLSLIFMLSVSQIP